ncbi:MAG: VCBS repeat-containing protein [Acidobacteriota bacterium]
MHNRRSLVFPAIALVLGCAGLASGQAVTITYPNNVNQRFKAGVDFATDVLGNPWDQSDRADYSIDPADNTWWSGFGQAGGTLSGVTATVNGYVDSQFKVLNRGFYNAVHPLNEISGARFPIDTATYTRLSFKLKTSSSPEAVTNVYWFRTMSGDPTNSSYSLGDSAGVKFAGQTAPGAARIFTVDLSGTPQDGVPWNGAPVLGLRLGLTNSEAGNAVDYDWIRLTNDDDVLPIAWLGSNNGTWTITATEVSGTQFNATGTSYTIASGLVAGTRSFNFAYGVLPPGTYNLHIANGAGAGDQLFTINDPPRVQVTSPNYTGGADFATDVIGDRWDLLNAADVDFAQFIHDAFFSPAGFHAVSDPGPGGNFGDPQVWLLDGFIDTAHKIDAGRYRFLTFTLNVAPPNDIGIGSVARILWSSQANPATGALPEVTVTKDMLVWPGRNTYTIDLAALNAGPDGGLEAATERWSAGRLMNIFRIDPHEFADARAFDLADVKIGAVNESSGNFTLGYNYYVEPGRTASLSFYYDTDLDPNNGKTLIGAVPLSDNGAGGPFTASGTRPWITSSIPSGTYYVYSEITDGIDTRGSYASGPIVITSTAPPPDADGDGLPDAFEVLYGLDPNSNAGDDGASGDQDGDGFSNLEEYNRGSNPILTLVSAHLLDLNSDRGGDVFLYNKATGARRFELANRFNGGFDEVINAWDPGWQVYPAHLDDNEYTDMFLYDPARGYWIQALNNGGDGTFTYSLGNWDSSWTVVPSDLDGDGLTDMFVYNFANGVWVKCFADGSGGFKGYANGNWDPGWTFYTADLNGDLRDDFFLYNQTNGVWVEAFSLPGEGGFDYPASGQWDPGWKVIRSDLNDDGLTDLFLLNAAGVHVSALSLAEGGFNYVGGPDWPAGASVVAGDLNHDGLTDLFLYYASTGVWAEAFSDGAGGFSVASGSWDPGWTVSMSDFNEDGQGDILLSRADGVWIKAINTGIGSFSYTAGNWGVGWTLFTNRSSDR